MKTKINGEPIMTQICRETLNQTVEKVEAFDIALQALIQLAKQIYGETTYKYYAIPVLWRSGRGSRKGYHSSPITGLDRYEISKEKWEVGKEQSKKDRMDAFMGKMRTSYMNYTREIDKPGWRENIIEIFTGLQNET